VCGIDPITDDARYRWVVLQDLRVAITTLMHHQHVMQTRSNHLRPRRQSISSDAARIECDSTAIAAGALPYRWIVRDISAHDLPDFARTDLDEL
jgi:hypothetical protein